jgi:hypothetical protein
MTSMLLPYSASDSETLATSVDVVSATYHTINHQVAYSEGDTYNVTDALLLQTLVGCGFADMTQVVTTVTVPDVTGQTEAAATTAITGAGLVVGTITNATHATIPAGSVISQVPTGGSQAATGSAVDLVISTGP